MDPKIRELLEAILEDERARSNPDTLRIFDRLTAIEGRLSTMATMPNIDPVAIQHLLEPLITPLVEVMERVEKRPQPDLTAINNAFAAFERRFTALEARLTAAFDPAAMTARDDRIITELKAYIDTKPAPVTSPTVANDNGKWWKVAAIALAAVAVLSLGYAFVRNPTDQQVVAGPGNGQASVTETTVRKIVGESETKVLGQLTADRTDFKTRFGEFDKRITTVEKQGEANATAASNATTTATAAKAKADAVEAKVVVLEPRVTAVETGLKEVRTGQRSPPSAECSSDRIYSRSLGRCILKPQ